MGTLLLGHELLFPSSNSNEFGVVWVGNYSNCAYSEGACHLQPLKDGNLSKHLHDAERVGLTAAAKEQALHQIQKASGDFIEDFASKQPAGHDLVNVEDLTSSFLAARVQPGPSLQQSKLNLYKGLLRRIMSHSEVGEQSGMLGILAGSNYNVYDVILTSNVADALQAPELRTRWKEMGYDVLGLAVFSPTHAAKHYKTALASLGSSSDVLMLLLMNGTNEPSCYELAVGRDSDLTHEEDLDSLTLTALSSTSENRKKGQTYTVVSIDKVGVSISDEASSLAQNALCSQVLSSFKRNVEIARSQTSSSSQGMERVEVEVTNHPIPADGLCFFHSINAGLCFQGYTQVPRHPSGYAKNVRQVQKEEHAAKSLREWVLKEHDHADPDSQARAADVAKDSGVEIQHLHWLAKTIGIRIRCTVAEHAPGYCI